MRRAEAAQRPDQHFSMAEIDGDRLDEREVLLTTTTLIMAGVEPGRLHDDVRLQPGHTAEARRAVVANPALLPDAVEESLRFNTSAQRFRRRLMKDVTLHGQTMRPATSSAWPTARATATSASTPTPTATTSPASRVATWALAAACTPAWARPSPGCRSRSPSTSSTRWCPTTGAWPTSWPGCPRPPSAARCVLDLAVQ
jgi:hypothetical protein